MSEEERRALELSGAIEHEDGPERERSAEQAERAGQKQQP